MKRHLLGALGALAMWAGQVKADDGILPISYVDDKAPAVLNGASCGDNGCNHHYCCGRGGFYAGLAFYFVQPNFETNPAGRVDFGDGFERQQDFTYNLDLAPSFWVGWQGESGYGGRIRYWEYAQGSTIGGLVPTGATVFSAQPLGLGPIVRTEGDFIAAQSTLNVLTWDFEVTKQWDCECWTILGAAGVRYAHLAQNYNVVTDAGTELASGHNFNGAGPTVALEAKRHIGGGGFAAYAISRLAFLYGTGQQSAYQPDAETKTLLERHARQADVIPYAELEIGLEANRDMGRYSLMMQSGLVGQVYWGAGNAANSEGIFTNGADNSSNLGFVGITLRFGVGF